MHTISRDYPAYFFTSITKDRLTVFQKDSMKTVVCSALSEARGSGGFALYAYVIMPDHIHIITDSHRRPSETLRYINGIVSHRIISYLKENDFHASLMKLRDETKERNYKHSLWDHHGNTFLITSESVMKQRVNYIHNNPVATGLCEKPTNYRFSSARIWLGRPDENEPLDIDITNIKWREA